MPELLIPHSAIQAFAENADQPENVKYVYVRRVEPLFTLKEVCSVLQKSEDEVMELIESGELFSLKHTK